MRSDLQTPRRNQVGPKTPGSGIPKDGSISGIFDQLTRRLSGKARQSNGDANVQTALRTRATRRRGRISPHRGFRCAQRALAKRRAWLPFTSRSWESATANPGRSWQLRIIAFRRSPPAGFVFCGGTRGGSHPRCRLCQARRSAQSVPVRSPAPSCAKHPCPISPAAYPGHGARGNHGRGLVTPGCAFAAPSAGCRGQGASREQRSSGRPRSQGDAGIRLRQHALAVHVTPSAPRT